MNCFLNWILEIRMCASSKLILSQVGNARRGASDVGKAKSSGADPRTNGGLVSNLSHPRVNKTKQHTQERKNEEKFNVVLTKLV